MDRFFFVAASLFGLIGVSLGAFGAHGLKAYLDPDLLVTFETGVRYQLYHAFLLLILGSTSFLGLKLKKIIFYKPKWY